MQAKKIIQCGLFVIIIFLIIVSINSYVNSVSAEETLVNGVCGSAAKIYFSNVNNFSGSFCSSGYLSAVPAFPQPGSSITWNCYGYGGGTHSTCNVSVTPISQACGTATKSYPHTASGFEGTFCSSGTLLETPTFPLPGSSVTWTCSESSSQQICDGTLCYSDTTTVNSNCTAFRLTDEPLVNGVCGYAARSYSSTATAFDGLFCLSGMLSVTPTFPEAGSSVYWSCYGTGGGNSDYCTASRSQTLTPVNAVCGTAAKTYSYTEFAFSGSFCYSGNITTTPTFPSIGSYSDWICYGLNGGTNISCSAYRSATAVDGVCGSAAKIYSSTTNAFYGTFCSSGNLSTTPYFPEPGAYVSWNCYGVSGGKHATCRAYKTSLTEPLVNGVCGSAAKTYSYTSTIFDGPYCSSGLILASPIFPLAGSSVSWTCYGTGGGASQTCTAYRSSLTTTPVNGSCGTAAKEYAYTATVFDGSLCSSGTVSSTPTFPAPGSSVSWTCYGSNGGSSATCTASRASTTITIVDAVCGTAANANYPSTATTLSGTLCSQGTPSTSNLYFLSGINTLTWECSVTGGTSVTCNASKVSTATPINGSCGTAAKEYTYAAAAFDGSFCSSGTVLSTPAFPLAGSSVSWTCSGSNGGSNITCTASRVSTTIPVNGSCGTAAKTYSYTETVFSGSFCLSGTISTTPTFPAPGSSVSWTCYGSEAGDVSSTNSVTCTASRSTAETIIYAACGTAAKEYPSTATAFDGSFCSSGTVSLTPTFPAAGSSVSWTCYGSGTNTTSSTNMKTCTASRLAASTCTKDEWKCDDWGICLNGTQKRTCTMTFDCPSVVTESPLTQQTCTVLEQKCVYVYSSWSDCKEGRRTRTIISKSSDNCLSWQPILEETCIMPSCTEDKWECTNWTSCSPEGKQQRECKLASDCNLVINKSPETSRSCVYVSPTIQTTTQNTSSGGSSVPTQTVAETVPEECSRAGFNNKSDCEVYLHQMRVANECLSKGIKTIEDCRNYLFQNYGRPLKCQGLTDSECETIIKNVILADLKNIITTEIAKQLADSAGNTATIQNNTLLVKDIQSGETTEVRVENIPIAESAEVKLITAENKSTQEVLSPVIIVFDTDGDGLPDDVEKRIGTYINKKDTDGDGIDDGEELRKGTNPLIANSQEQLILSKVEKAIVNGESLEQPKFNELAVSQNLSVQTVENFVLEETGKNIVRVQGKSKANEVVTLYIYSTMPVVVTVKSDNNGNWVYDLDKTLVNGKHEIYVAINDDKGRIVESGLPKLFFIEEAKAVVMDDFIKMEDASMTSDRSDDLMHLYIVAGIIFITIFVLIFLLIKRQMTGKYE